MSPRARRCEGCGGPLPDAPAGVSTVSCSFCGTVHDIQTADRPMVLTVDVRQMATHLTRPIKIAIGVGLGAVALVVALTVLRAMRPVTDALDAVRKQAKTMQEAALPIAPSELGGITGRGWRQVQASPPPGGWTAFEPVAGVEWARTIARGWASDAQLTRIDVTRVSAVGVSNVGGRDDMVGYRFVSPARIEEWGRIADREVNAQVAYELMMQVVKEQVMASVHRGRPPSRAVPPALDSLKLGELLERARQRKTFPEHPFYAGYLIHLEREGWVWYFSSLSQRDSLPRVRARDAAVYPYR